MGNIRSRFEQMYASGFISLNRGRDCAKLTIPSILPPEGFNETMTLDVPWQSVGAYSVNNLASKLALVLFPPGGVFFRLIISDFVFNQMMDERNITDPKQREDLKNELVLALSVIERAAMEYLETNGWRAALAQALKHLIVVNSCLLYVRPGTNKLRTLRRDHWVCKRNLDGEVVEIITKEGTTWEELPEAIRQRLSASGKGSEIMSPNLGGDLSTTDGHNGSMLASSLDPTNLDIFTRAVVGKDGRFHVSQEIRDVDIGVIDIYTRENLPWVVVTWDLMSGENYGRSLVEHHLGDFRSLEALSQCIVEYSAAAAKLVPLVNPNGVTCLDDLSHGANGQFIPGRKEDVGFLTTDKYFDLKIPQEVRQELKQMIFQAFLVNSSIQRQAERVTAEEIRVMATELEDALGGAYSLLAVTLQLPLSRLIMNELEKLPEFPKVSQISDTVKPMVVAGVEGLGKAHEMQRMLQALGVLQTSPEGSQMIKWGNVIKRIFALSNVDATGLVKSEEEIQAERKAAQEAQAQLAMVPNAMKGINDMGVAQMKTQQNSEGGPNQV